jgi:nitrogen fixation protein NifT
MKIMIRRLTDGRLSVYVPKKDLEETITEMERDTLWGGTVVLTNGWRLELPEMPESTALPVTVEAKRV